MLLACARDGTVRTSSSSARGTATVAEADIDRDSIPPGGTGQWRMAGGDYANTRFSQLDEITTGNVRGLEVSWTFSTGVLRGQEAAPIVVGSTMYLVTPFPNILHARNLDNPGTTRWSFEPKPLSAAQGMACCNVVNRGAAFADGRVFFNTLDNQTIAVDAETGTEIWRTKMGDINQGESMTMAPLVVAALDAATGKIHVPVGRPVVIELRAT